MDYRLGKLVVPNVFVNIELLKTLVKKCNAMKTCIQIPSGDAFIRFNMATIYEVFDLSYEVGVPLSFEELEEEYRTMDMTYQGWTLAIHMVEKGKLMDKDGPGYDVNILKQYLQYTYMACR